MSQGVERRLGYQASQRRPQATLQPVINLRTTFIFVYVCVPVLVSLSVEVQYTA